MASESNAKTRWDNYPDSLAFMLWAITTLQANKKGIDLAHRLPRKTPNHAAMTALRNGVEVYTATKPGFSRFTDTVIADYLSPLTEPSTFEKPFYLELKRFLVNELERQKS